MKKKERLKKTLILQEKLNFPEVVKDSSGKGSSSTKTVTKGTSSSPNIIRKRDSFVDDDITNSNPSTSTDVVMDQLLSCDPRESLSSDEEEDLDNEEFERANEDDDMNAPDSFRRNSDDEDEHEVMNNLNITPEQANFFKEWMHQSISKALQERDRVDAEKYLPHKVRSSESATSFVATHIYITKDGLNDTVNSTEVFNKWLNMIFTSDMSKDRRNLSMSPCLKDTLTLICPAFARKETIRLSRQDNPLAETWENYDNDELSRLIKFQFDRSSGQCCT